MNALTFHVTDDVRVKIEDMAAERGMSVDAILHEMTDQMVSEFEAYKLFAERAQNGKDKIADALRLLKLR